jgi:hypothetical protein
LNRPRISETGREGFGLEGDAGDDAPAATAYTSRILFVDGPDIAVAVSKIASAVKNCTNSSVQACSHSLSASSIAHLFLNVSGRTNLFGLSPSALQPERGLGFVVCSSALQHASLGIRKTKITMHL